MELTLSIAAVPMVVGYRNQHQMFVTDTVWEWHRSVYFEPLKIVRAGLRTPFLNTAMAKPS